MEALEGPGSLRQVLVRSLTVINRLVYATIHQERSLWLRLLHEWKRVLVLMQPHDETYWNPSHRQYLPSLL